MASFESRSAERLQTDPGHGSTTTWWSGTSPIAGPNELWLTDTTEVTEKLRPSVYRPGGLSGTGPAQIVGVHPDRANVSVVVGREVVLFEGPA